MDIVLESLRSLRPPKSIRINYIEANVILRMAYYNLLKSINPELKSISTVEYHIYEDPYLGIGLPDTLYEYLKGEYNKLTGLNLIEYLNLELDIKDMLEDVVLVYKNKLANDLKELQEDSKEHEEQISNFNELYGGLGI